MSERPRTIVHLDADAFFASVEQAADAKLRGKPIAVGGEKRGIIASASYEARRFGVYTPMPTVQARKLCPKLIVLPGNYERYEDFSRWMFSYAYDFTPDVEQTSIDEGYYELTASPKPASQVADTVRKAIRQKLKLTVSEGVGCNKLVSQIASKLNKPAGFTQIPSGQEIPFLHPLPNKWLPGIGPKTSTRLNSAGLACIGQIAATPTEMLELLMGRQAQQLKLFANGIEDRPVVPVNEPAKSFGHQETFSQDQTDEERLEATLKAMADSLMAKVRADGKSIRTITVKVRYNDMAEDQRSRSLLEPTNLETDIYGHLSSMLKEAWQRRVSLRMVALKLSNLYDARFQGSFEAEGLKQEARRRLAVTIDQLRNDRGRGVVLRGHDLLLREKPKEPAKTTICVSIKPKAAGYVPLNVHSYYSFLDSTLSPKDIVGLAVKNKLPAIAMTDPNLHGAVEFYQAAKQAGIKPVIGAEVRKDELWLYVASLTGYQNLCRILSDPKRLGDTAGLIAVSTDPKWAEQFHGRFYQGIKHPEELKKGFLHPVVAINAIHYADPNDRWKFDILQSIRTLTLLKQKHPEKREGDCSVSNWRHEEILRNGMELVERCCFELPLGKPQFPAFKTPDGSSSKDYLRRLVVAGLRRRYPLKHPSLLSQIDEELAIIGEVGYEDYFLVVWDLLQGCRGEGIEWITRGSAADSLVCYCLGISDVCPIRFDLYFRRFLNKDRMALNKLPDIDIDFPHDRKDDVIDLLFQRYGTEFCSVVGGFSTYQARGAVGDIGKVLGVSEYQIRRFTEHFPWVGAKGLAEKIQQNLECQDTPFKEEPYRSILEMAEFLDGFPRYPKMHPCGVVVSRQPIHQLTPTFISNKGYPTTHYDMEAVEQMGLVKLDVLAQGGLAVMRDVKEAVKRRGIAIDLSALEPWEDPAVWGLIADGQARAVHHIESPAMISLCRMTNVRDIDTLIAIVSVIRPGAANENKKQAFTRRYQGLEETVYPHPSLEPCLRSTFGLVVYEEHILQICEMFAGLPPGRADVLRRALGKAKVEAIKEIRDEFIVSARRRGHQERVIGEVWDMVAGFAGYAFCKAHSTAYGVEAYQAAWLKLNHPAEFMAAVLSNGKGFYDPVVYVLECHRLGIQMLPPTINQPGPSFEVEGGRIRVPVVAVKGLTERTIERLLDERKRSEFKSLKDFYLRTMPTPEELELLLRVGAFDCFGQQRTQQFWEVQFLTRTYGDSSEPGQGWLLPPPSLEKMPATVLKEPDRMERLKWEAELLGYPCSGHPLELFPDVAWETYCPIERLGEFIGEEVVVCGLIIEQRTHHQITGEPMKFMTLCDWTGMVETELFAASYRSYGLATVRYPVLEVVAVVEPYENGRGFSLRVLRAGRARNQDFGTLIPNQ